MEGKEFLSPASEESMPEYNVSELSERARDIRGNRTGPKSWQRAIWETFKEHKITDPATKAELFVKIADKVGLSDAPNTARIAVSAEADERHKRALRSRGD